MDEYDAPVNTALINYGSDEEKKKVIDLLRILMTKTFKGNEYVEKGLITGILRIAKSSILSHLNNLVEFNMNSEELFNLYGFTENEVDILLKRMRVDESLKDSIRDWYNGYKLGDMRIYNPWSIISCLEKYNANKDIIEGDEKNIEKNLELRKVILKNYW